MRMKDRHRRLARERFWDEHDRSEYECPDCGRSKPDVGKFEVHHKDGDPHNNSIQNLIGLCRYCHCVREDRKPPMEAIVAMREVNSSNHTLQQVDRRVVNFVQDQTEEPPHDAYVEPFDMLIREFEREYSVEANDALIRDMEIALNEIMDADVGQYVFEKGEGVFVEGIWYCG
jgi:hypothetical protein